MAAKHMATPNALTGDERRSGGFKVMVMALLAAAAIYLSGRLAVLPLCERLGWDSTLVVIAYRSLLVSACVIALGGASWYRPSFRAIFRGWRFLGYLIIVHLVIGGLSIVSHVAELSAEELAAVPRETLISNAIYFTVLCILVGINEELLFRGLVFGGLLAILGDKRNGVIWAALVSSFAFGFIHVAADLDVANPAGILQGIMKTVQAGMQGFLFCAMVTEERNFWGAITAHGFFDWLIIIGSIYTGMDEVGIYVSTDMRIALISSAVFAILSLIYIPKAIKAWRILRDAQTPLYGPFAKRLKEKVA